MSGSCRVSTSLLSGVFFRLLIRLNLIRLNLIRFRSRRQPSIPLCVSWGGLVIGHSHWHDKSRVRAAHRDLPPHRDVRRRLRVGMGAHYARRRPDRCRRPLVRPSAGPWRPSCSGYTAPALARRGACLLWSVDAALASPYCRMRPLEVQFRTAHAIPQAAACVVQRSHLGEGGTEPLPMMPP